MKVLARSVFSQARQLVGETDVFEIRRVGASLEIITRSLLDESPSLHVHFAHYEALFETDEGNLPDYWSSGQFKDAEVFEVIEGGLLSREKLAPGLLAVTSALPGIREWLVATSGTCVSILTLVEPSCTLKT